LLNADAPDGNRIPVTWTDGRPAIPVRTDDHARWMVLDSGTPIAVLFGNVDASGAIVCLFSNNGSTAGRRTGVRVLVPGVKPKHLPAAVVTTAPTRDGGLLPLRIFSSIYVNNRERYVIVRDR
jgi:hypothetical protein